MEQTFAERVARYAYRYWMRHHMEQWPTVAEAANALKIRRSDIEDCCGDGPYQLTGYNRQKYTLGDLHVEAMTADVEAAWCAYWLPFSAGCYCGRHDITGRVAA